MPEVGRKTATIVFCDVAGSTGLGEQLDPETVRSILERYFAEMRRVVERHGGTVEKFIGDAVVAVFGVPTIHENDALRAIRAAAGMREALDELNDAFQHETDVRIDTRIGVNTGEVVVGDPSSGQSFVTGDCVNVAARLQQMAAPGEILLGDATHRRVHGAVDAEAIQPLVVRGKADAVRAWRLLGVNPGVDRIPWPEDTPFVGRQSEIQELHRWLNDAVALRRCRLVTCIGAPGVGKSRLANEFIRGVDKSSIILRGHCLEYGEGITYAPIAEIVTGLGGIDSAVSRIQKAGERDVARRQMRRAIGAEGGVSSTAEISAALRSVIAALASDSPVVMLLDDIHWAEPTLLDTLEFLVGSLADAAVLILCLARADILDSRPGWPDLAGNAHTLVLDPLSQSDSATVLASDEAGVRLDSHHRTRLLDAAAGNPLFIQQMLASINEDPALVETPPTVHALIAARLERLSEDQRAIIEVAAVEGEHFQSRTIQDLLPGDSATVNTQLAVLAQKQIVRPDRGASDEGFRFVHALVREVAYRGLSKSRRADLHERFALLLATSPGAEDEVVGFHLENAYRYYLELRLKERAAAVGPMASRCLGDAGRRAFERGDVAATVNLLERAASLPSRDETLSGRDRIVLGSALARAGNFARCDEVLNGVITSAMQSENRSLELGARVEQAAWRLWQEPANATQAHKVAKEAIAYFAQHNDGNGLARSWRLLGDAEPTWHASLLALERAVEHARAVKNVREESDALWWVGVAMHFGPLHVDDAINRCRAILDTVGDDRTLEAGIRGILAGLVAMKGSFEEARQLYTEGFAILADLGLKLRMATRRTISGAVELLAGDPVAAERELRWAIERLDAMGEGLDRPGIAAQLSQALYEQGRDEEAEVYAEMSDRGVHGARVRYRYAVRAKLLARRGEFPAAIEAARQIAAAAAGDDNLNSQAHALVDLAQVLQLAGQPGEASRHIKRAMDLYELKGNLVSAAGAKALFVSTGLGHA